MDSQNAPEDTKLSDETKTNITVKRASVVLCRNLFHIQLNYGT